MCTASRQYQRNKIKELDTEDISPDVYKSRFQKIVEKSCLCMGLGAATEQIHGMQTERPAKGVAVCPGPNMAYFSKIMSLKEITDHIYGRIDIISHTARPHMFLKELKLYAEHLKAKIEETQGDLNKRQEKYLLSFTENMKEGVNYYQQLFSKMKDKLDSSKTSIMNDLQSHMMYLDYLEIKIKKLTQVS
jgi:hypothetical protein